jgi:hypothetical protein
MVRPLTHWIACVALVAAGGCAKLQTARSHPDVNPPTDAREALLDAIGLGEAAQVEKLLAAGRDHQ